MSTSLNTIALSATLHCLTGCAIGEVLGMVLGSWLGWDPLPTIVVSIVLAFFFGYSLTLLPLLRAGILFKKALRLAFASDTISIAIMEVVDNILMVVIPGAMESGPTTFLFWISMVLSLLVAGAVAFPVNRWLITRGRGHAVVHAQHEDALAADSSHLDHTHEGGGMDR